MIAHPDNAREESHRLDSNSIEQNRKTDQQEQELKAAKARMERKCRDLERHAKDMDAAQAKIPKGVSLCFLHKAA